MRLSILLVAIGLCQAQAPIATPVIGKMLDASGTLRPLYGVSGNFTIGPREAVRVISAACSASLCLAKTANMILGPKRSSAAPSGPALFALDGAEAVLYFPESNQFARWRQSRLRLLPWRLEGEVLSMRTSFERTEIAVRRGADVWIVRPDGAILDSLGDVAGPVLLLDNGTVLASGDDLVLRRDAGNELRFELPGILNLSALGEEYVQVTTAADSFALRTTRGRESLLVLPTPAPARVSAGGRAR